MAIWWFRARGPVRVMVTQVRGRREMLSVRRQPEPVIRRRDPQLGDENELSRLRHVPTRDSGKPPCGQGLDRALLGGRVRHGRSLRGSSGSPRRRRTRPGQRSHRLRRTSCRGSAEWCSCRRDRRSVVRPTTAAGGAVRRAARGPMAFIDGRGPRWLSISQPLVSDTRPAEGPRDLTHGRHNGTLTPGWSCVGPHALACAAAPPGRSLTGC